MRNQHDDPGATSEPSGTWRWASSEFQVDGKDGVIASGVTKSLERQPPEWSLQSERSLCST